MPCLRPPYSKCSSDDWVPAYRIRSKHTSGVRGKGENLAHNFRCIFLSITYKIDSLARKACPGSTFCPSSTDRIMGNHPSVATSEAGRNHHTSSREAGLSITLNI